MKKRIEIRAAKKGWIVSLCRGPLLQFRSADESAVAGALSAVNDGELCAIRDDGVSLIELPPIEWAVASSDEALSIARKLLEGEAVA